jgi:hypothetical protein
MNETPTSAAAPKEVYERPEVEIVGSVADLTLNDFSKGNDVGGGKSGTPGGSD